MCAASALGSRELGELRAESAMKPVTDGHLCLCGPAQDPPFGAAAVETLPTHRATKNWVIWPSPAKSRSFRDKVPSQVEHQASRRARYGVAHRHQSPKDSAIWLIWSLHELPR
jgi:hypothetical protein